MECPVSVCCVYIYIFDMGAYVGMCACVCACVCACACMCVCVHACVLHVTVCVLCVCVRAACVHACVARQGSVNEAGKEIMDDISIYSSIAVHRICFSLSPCSGGRKRRSCCPRPSGGAVQVGTGGLWR